MRLSEELDDKKYKLFEKAKIDTWGIKDQLFLEQNREQLQADFDFASFHMLSDETL